MEITEFIIENSLIFGIVAFLLAMMLIIINLKRKQRSFNEHSYLSWKSFVNRWAAVITLILMGLMLVLSH